MPIHTPSNAPWSPHGHSPTLLMPDFLSSFPRLARFRFRMRALHEIRMPDYPGSAWRGLLGRGLRDTACVTHQPTCKDCLLDRQCVYSTLFETPAPPDTAARGYTALPHPYVLAIDPRAPRHVASGESFSLTLHLLGAAIGQVPYLIHALKLAGRLGFGHNTGRFELLHADHETGLGTGHWQTVYSMEQGTFRTLETSPPNPPPLASTHIRLSLDTPLRIKRDGHFIGPRDLCVQDLIRTLQRRLRDLARHHGGNPQALDLRHLMHTPSALTWHPIGLRWHEWTRYSSRQNTRMQFGGLIGEIDLDGPALPELWPAVWLGQWTHLGKGTTFGLGGYRILNGGETENGQHDSPTS